MRYATMGSRSAPQASAEGHVISTRAREAGPVMVEVGASLLAGFERHSDITEPTGR